MTSALLQLGEGLLQLLAETLKPLRQQKNTKFFLLFSSQNCSKAASVKLGEEKCDLEPSGLWRVSLL